MAARACVLAAWWAAVALGASLDSNALHSQGSGSVPVAIQQGDWLRSKNGEMVLHLNAEGTLVLSDCQGSVIVRLCNDGATSVVLTENGKLQYLDGEGKRFAGYAGPAEGVEGQNPFKLVVRDDGRLTVEDKLGRAVRELGVKDANPGACPSDCQCTVANLVDQCDQGVGHERGGTHKQADPDKHPSPFAGQDRCLGMGCHWVCDTAALQDVEGGGSSSSSSSEAQPLSGLRAAAQVAGAATVVLLLLAYVAYRRKGVKAVAADETTPLVAKAPASVAAV